MRTFEMKTFILHSKQLPVGVSLSESYAVDILTSWSVSLSSICSTSHKIWAAVTSHFVSWRHVSEI